MVQTASRLIGLRELHEELEKQWTLDHFIDASRLVDHLLDEALLDRHNSVVWHIGCVVHEESVDH